MELHIQNFRSIIDRTITLPESGTVSITGTSGAGKSTILNAIHFVLYGAKQNVAPKDENVSTKVTLKFKDVTVTRKKKPNRLQVKRGDHQYEDDNAQAVIIEVFGAEQIFDIASYIRQGEMSKFVTMKDAEKKSLILDLAIGYDIDTMKSSVESLLKDVRMKRDNEQRDVRDSEIRYEPYEDKTYSRPNNLKELHSEFMTFKDVRFKDQELRDELVRAETALQYAPNTNETPEEISARLNTAHAKCKELQNLMRTNSKIIENQKRLAELTSRSPAISESELQRLKYLKPCNELLKIKNEWRTYNMSLSIEMCCPYCEKSVHKLGDKLYKIEDTPKSDCVRPKSHVPSDADIEFAQKHQNIDIQAEQKNFEIIKEQRSLEKFKDCKAKDPKQLELEYQEVLGSIAEIKKLQGRKKIDVRPPSQIKAELDAELRKKERKSGLEKILREAKLALEKHKLKIKLRDARVQLDETNTKLASLEHLKGAIDTSCSELLDTFLAAVNHTVNEVLEEIFDEPINLQISAFKDVKTRGISKSNINFKVHYRGMILSKLNYLSGGEQSRVSLALLIAFALVSPSKVTMIDESMASLHLDMRVSAIECMKS